MTVFLFHSTLSRPNFAQSLLFHAVSSEDENLNFIRHFPIIIIVFVYSNKNVFPQK